MKKLACVFVTVLTWLGAASASAQEEGRMYAGALAGIATLSADARALTQPGRVEVSLYKPENGASLNLFAGLHVRRYVTVQANYVWNRNDLTLFASLASAGLNGFYEQPRASTQHALVGDALLYFRARGERVRPYLSAGAGVVRFESAPAAGVNNGLAAPAGEIAATRLAMRVAVGIDLAMGGAWDFRYSFSETISGNPISATLLPQGQRNLANFQNLFGFVRRF